MSNLALVSLNLSDFSETAKWCSKHLEESEEPNKKVVFRRASAYKGLHEWDLAKRECQKAMEEWTDEETKKDFLGLV